MEGRGGEGEVQQQLSETMLEIILASAFVCKHRSIQDA